ncbi:hypothetical protein CERSUDRAFT_93478 [Gelatoporia subvermispora B]|uniref:RING-type domain-containing protein n=1 Tax=Ceriporiopsis subvermispora (strain B) TaxID=914234 RepID=M2QLR5_CERS8|nr:hypothetical protein CERSUDRAFT_93478 [Gelatoporia subvermispora B]
MATRCGHLYCTECATTNFNQDDAMCAICRRPWTFDELVMLYPDYSVGAPPGASAIESGGSEGTRQREHERAKLDTLAAEAVESCLETLEDGKDSDSTWQILSKVDDLAQTLSGAEIEHTAHNLYRCILSLLTELTMTIRLDTGRVRELELDATQLQEAVCNLMDELETSKEDLDRYRRKSESADSLISTLASQTESVVKERNEILERSRTAEERIHALTAELDRIRRSGSGDQRSRDVTAEQENELNALKTEVSNGRLKLEEAAREREKSHDRAERYKTKYLKLKEQIDILHRFAGGDENLGGPVEPPAKAFPV